MNKELIGELEFCLKIWSEKGGCTFGGGNRCAECAAPYLLLKLINGEIIHGKGIKRLTLEDWKSKLDYLNKT